MRTHGSKFGVKTRPQNCQKLENILGKLGFFLLLNSNFPHTKFNFLQQLSNFQEIQENLLQRLSDFFNGFLLSLTHFYFL